MTKTWLITVTAAIVVVAGCSRSASTSTAAGVGAATVAATMPSLTATTSSATTPVPAEPPPKSAPNGGNASPPSAAPAPVSPFPEMGDLFAPPKIVVPVVTAEPEPEPEPEPVAEPVAEQPKKVKPLPQLRLVGFVEVEGLKALLSVEGKLNVVTIGDSPEGLQIIAIEPPVVTLKNGQEGEEFQMNLYEQPWFHPAGAVTGERKTIGNKPVMQKATPPATTAGGIGGGAPIGAPQIPGVGGNGVNGPPGVPGFGGAIGPPAAPGFNATGMPGIPGVPGDTAHSTTQSKNSKRSAKSTRDNSNTNPGTPSLPGGNTLPGGAPGLPGK